MIITIARQCGCGAVHVGKLLAEHYGIPFYTRRHLLEMAEREGMLESLEDFFEERPVNELMFAMSSFGETGRQLTEKPQRILADMIGDKSCVIIGRCGNYMFRHHGDLVSVFLRGYMDDRIKNIMEERHLPENEAADFVEHMDDCRKAYHKYYTGLDWGNADDYDICLNSTRLGYENTAAMIEKYIKEVGI